MAILIDRFDYQPLLPGRVLAGGRYIVDRTLSIGGMGALVVAHDTAQDDLPVVIKGLVPYFDVDDPVEVQQACARLRHEASLLEQLRFPAIPRFMGWFEEQGCPYLVMEYLSGADLLEGLTHTDADSGTVRYGLPYPQDDVLRWGVVVCRVLEYLHGQEPAVLHQDLKPENILVDRASDLIWLVDFGTARFATAPSSVQPGQGPPSAYGTPGYAPPEQYRGQSEPRSDVYGLAATLYHLLTDDDPREHPLQFPRLDQLGDLGPILQAALNHDPASRPDATGFRRALSALLPADSHVLHAPDGTRLEHIPALVAWCERNREEAQRWLTTTLPVQLRRQWDVPQTALAPFVATSAALDPGQQLDTFLAQIEPGGYGTAPPQLHLPTDTLEVDAFANGTPSTYQLRVQNSGRRPTKVAVSLPSWLAVDKPAFRLEPGKSVTLRLTTDFDGGQPSWGMHKGTVTLDADGRLFSILIRARVSPLRDIWKRGGNWLRLMLVLAALVTFQLGRWVWDTANLELRYRHAIATYEQGDYEAAYHEFEALGIYSDARAKLVASRYQAGREAIQHRDWAAAREALLPIRSYEGVDRLLDLNEIQEQTRHQRIIQAIPSSGDILDLDISNDGKLIATAHSDGTVGILEGGLRTTLITEGRAAPTTVAFSPNGEVIIFAGPGVPVQAWRWRDPIRLWQRNWSTSAALDLAFSADGKSLYFLMVDQGGRVLERWGARDGIMTERITNTNLGLTPSVGALSDDGRLGAYYGENRIVIVSLASNEIIREISCPFCTIHRMAFSLDGQMLLVSRNSDTRVNMVELWDLSGPRIHDTIHHDVDQDGIALSADGSTLVTGTNSGMLIFWNIDP